MKSSHRIESEDYRYCILFDEKIADKRLPVAPDLLTCITVPGKRKTDKKTPESAPVSETSQPLFGREQAHLIKGMAIIMLILHHLFLFPSTNPWFTSIVGTRWGGVEFFLSAVSKLCISLFFFVSGYGLYQASRRDTKLLQSSLRRIVNIYCVYTTAVIATVLIFLLLDGSLVFLSVRHTVETFLGINVAINGSWWFFIIYVELLLLTPAAVLFVRKFSWKLLFTISILLYLFALESGFPFFSSVVEHAGLSSVFYGSFPIKLFWYNQLYFFTGFCMAASGILENILHKSLTRLRHPMQRYSIALFLITAILFGRYHLIDLGVFAGILSMEKMNIYEYTRLSSRADFILGPLFIYSLLLLFYRHRIPTLRFLGKHSASIWLIHGTIISLLMTSFGKWHPWSPLAFALILLLSSAYALLYSSAERFIWTKTVTPVTDKQQRSRSYSACSQRLFKVI